MEPPEESEKEGDKGPDHPEDHPQGARLLLIFCHLGNLHLTMVVVMVEVLMVTVLISR